MGLVAEVEPSENPALAGGWMALFGDPVFRTDDTLAGVMTGLPAAVPSDSARRHW